MKYKVGDKVIIKPYLKEDESYGGQTIVEPMLEYLGKEAIIKSGEKSGINGNYFNIDIDSGHWCWTSEMFVGAVTEAELNAKDTFNVGDKVVIRNDLIVGKPYDTGCLFITQMQDYCNKLATIINCYYPMLGGIRYHLDIDRGRFAWSSDMLLSYSENSQTTNQTTNQNENQLQRKEACISRGDQYTGRRVLYTRRKAKISVGHLSYKEIAQRNLDRTGELQDGVSFRCSKDR